MNRTRTLVVAVVGIDGSGKSSAFRGALERLALRADVVGIGDQCIAGAPGAPLRVRSDMPAERVTRAISRAAKRTRQQWLYRQLKTLDLVGRARLREHVVREEAPAVVLTDGDPLVNTLSWSVGRLYPDRLLRDDRRVLDVLGYLAGDARIPRSQLRYYLRHAWQLVLVNRLGWARFGLPDVVVLLRLDGPRAMERIERRGRLLQVHETAPALDALGAGYERICGLIEAHHGVRVVRIEAARSQPEETVRVVVEAVLHELAQRAQAKAGDPAAPPIEVVATTISGSLQDQRKIRQIVPRFADRTRRPTRLHAVDDHVEATLRTRDIVARGGRVIVSAGGAGTFNAVLEGCHQDGRIPADVRLAFLRKGSADLIGKALRVPDQLPAAVSAIVDGIERDRHQPADVIAVETTDRRGVRATRHLVGFGGLGLFGAVPHFTEARWVKYYKGIIGSLAGDYGPFYVGLTLATLWWAWLRFRNRVVPLALELDGLVAGPQRWTAIIVVGGDLGPDFPLGRGVSFGDGTFRVIALRDRGWRCAWRQLAAARRGAILDEPDRYDSLACEASTLLVRPTDPVRAQDEPLFVNVDGLAQRSHGPVRFSISGQVALVAGP